MGEKKDKHEELSIAVPIAIELTGIIAIAIGVAVELTTKADIGYIAISIGGILIAIGEFVWAKVLRR